jgi:hypothetical protein
MIRAPIRYVAFLSCVAMSSVSGAAESPPAADQNVIETRFSMEARTYFREHRLRAYEKTRAATIKGATCVTPKMVCWLDEPTAGGNACACETPPLGVVPGIVGG